MAEALILCPEAPYPVVGGGPVRTACVLEYLAARYELDMIVFREPGAPDPREPIPPGLVRHVEVIDLPYQSKTPGARAWRNLARFAIGTPPLVDRFSGFPLPLTGNYDVAVVEHFWCAGYVSALRPHCRRVVLNLHNIESVLLDRCAETESPAARLLFRRFASECCAMERDLLPQFDLLLVASRADQSRAGGVVCPNTLPFTPMPETAKREEIVFSGNLAYHPNIAAARYFEKRIWPELRALHPDLIWKLIGKNPEALRLKPGPRIRMTGPVEDAVRALAECRVAVVPLLSGSGTRIKILEAWAAGLPVVSTTIGAEGLDAAPGRDLLLADSPSGFVHAVDSVLRDPSLASRLSQSGRALYEKHFTWPSSWRTLEEAGL